MRAIFWGMSPLLQNFTYACPYDSEAGLGQTHVEAKEKRIKTYIILLLTKKTTQNYCRLSNIQVHTPFFLSCVSTYLLYSK